jgi:gliding motility-associated-like protein
MKFYQVALCLALSFLACKDDEPESALKGCCGNEAINQDVGNGHIYVANIFTPNGDGINDRLEISTQNVSLIVEVEIRDHSGGVVFESFDTELNNASDGWDGKVNGVVSEGVYNISVQVLAEDGSNHTVNGKVCNFPCDDNNLTEKVSSANCAFPSQANIGHFDPTIPSGEQLDCFE